MHVWVGLYLIGSLACLMSRVLFCWRVGRWVLLAVVVGWRCEASQVALLAELFVQDVPVLVKAAVDALHLAPLTHP